MNDTETRILRQVMATMVAEAPQPVDFENLTDAKVMPEPIRVRTVERFRWRPVVVFVAATLAVLVIGLPLLVFGVFSSAPVARDLVTTPTTPVTTPTEPVTTRTEPSPPATVPAPLLYEEVLDGSVAAISTSIALASDGSPIIAYLASDIDIFGDEETTISVIRLVICLDPQCAKPPSVVNLEDVEFQAHTPYLTVDPFNRPVIGYRGAQGSTIAFCNDPECTTFETRQVEEADVVVSAWAFTAEGNPVYTEAVQIDLQSLDLIVCLDRFCDATSRTRIDTGFIIDSSQMPRVGTDGSVLVVYALDEPIDPPDPEALYDGADFFGTQKVAWCADATCPDGPVITTIDEGINVGGGALFDGGEAGDEIWFVTASEYIRTPTGPEDEHLAVVEVTYGKATCLNTACTEFELTHFGPYEMAGSPSSPLPYGLPEMVALDGSRIEVHRRETALVLERFSEAEGGTWSFTTLATYQVHRLDWARDVSLAIGEHGLPIVIYGDDTGVHIIRCPDLACTPPDSG